MVDTPRFEKVEGALLAAAQSSCACCLCQEHLDAIRLSVAEEVERARQEPCPHAALEGERAARAAGIAQGLRQAREMCGCYVCQAHLESQAREGEKAEVENGD